MGKTKNLTYGLLFAGLGLASLGGINNLNTNKGDNKSRFIRVERIRHNNGTLVELFYSNVHADSDNTPPITEVNHQPLDPNDTSDVYLIANAKDFESGVREFKVFLDNLGNKNPDSIFFDPFYPDSIAVSIPLSDVWPGGPEGTHTYNSESINSVGLVGNDPPSPLNENKITNDDLSLSVPTKSFTVNSSIMTVPAGWAMVSLPRQATNSTVSGLFSSALTPAYHFNPESSSYGGGDTLQPGKGYWIKFASEETLPVIGDSINQNSIPVDKGWNQIATKNNEKLNVPIVNISSSPSDIISSHFYYYDPEEKNYELVTVLERSKSYWIKATQAGNLFINDSPVSVSQPNLESILEMPPAPPGERNTVNQVSLNVNVYQSNGALNFDYVPKGNSHIEMYDITGRKVTEISKDAGNVASWKMLNNNSTGVSNGAYFFRIIDNGEIINYGEFINMDKKIFIKNFKY